MQSIEAELSRFAHHFEKRLDRLLSNNATSFLTNHGSCPDGLWQAIRYAVLGGGKRLRPFLLAQSAALFGIDENVAIDTAIPVELIHSYSLVHDDLPAMDDDDLRRGRPTLHKAYNEATAILAGDALLTMAFEAVAAMKPQLGADITLTLSQRLAVAAGPNGMVGGQMRDLAAENLNLPEDGIRTLQAMKTGALFVYCLEAGGLIGHANEDQMGALSQFGHIIGLAFQIADDLLDHEADTATIGKRSGKDAEKGKATPVNLLGVDQCRKLLQNQLTEAKSSLSIFFDRAEPLLATARFITSRRN